jgi:multidrug resistance efflux pump
MNVAGLDRVRRKRYGEDQTNPALVSPSPVPRAVENTPAPSRARQLAFRCVRILVAAGILSTVAFYTREFVDHPGSEQAYINGEITALRAPIAGQVQFDALAPGHSLPAGMELFTIENTRFGNQEVAAQLNFAGESVERLQAESEEAALRFKQQEEVYRIHQKLYDEKVLSRLALLEEQTKLEVAGAVMTNKQTLAVQARDRCATIKRQVELQRAAVVKMPFDGVAWAVSAKNGAEVSTHETVVEILDPKRIWVDAFFQEKHAQKLAIGTAVEVRTADGAVRCGGTVEWVRAGVGRIPCEGTAAVAPGDYIRRRVAVRVKLDAECAFRGNEFFGVGRSVIVTVSSHE